MNKELAQTHWDQESQKWQLIVEQGGLTNAVNELDDRRRLTVGLERVLACMDEGVKATADGLYPAFRCAGAGILTDISLKGAVWETVKLVNAHQIVAIADHKFCGAGGAKAKRLGLNPEDGDRLAADHARAVAKEAGIKHLTMPLMRPTAMHIATCTYIADVPFNPAPLVDGEGRQILPEGFVVTRSLGRELTVHDVEMSVVIAFSSHGYGREKFSKANPFRLVLVVNHLARASELRKELLPVADKFGDLVAFEDLVLAYINFKK